MASSEQTRVAPTAVLGMAACALPLGVRAFLTAGGQGARTSRAPVSPILLEEGARPLAVALPSSVRGQKIEEPRPASSMASLGCVFSAAVVAAVPAGRHCRRAAARARGCRFVQVARAAAEEGSETNLAEQLETKLNTLRERERKLIERIEAVQQTIGDTEAAAAKDVETEGAAEEEVEKAEEPEEPASEEPETAVAAEATSSSPVNEAYQELATLEGLADMHEDTTKQEIRMLEELSGQPKGLSVFREAGKKLKELISSEYKALRSRESELADKIAKTQQEIQEVEKAAADAAENEGKVLKELHILEGLASAYEDNTAAEIKALEKLAKGGKA